MGIMPAKLKSIPNGGTKGSNVEHRHGIDIRFLTDDEIVRMGMRLLGQRTSKRKAKSSRENGKLGGAPRKHKHAPKRPV